MTFDEETILFQRTRKGRTLGQDGHQLVKRSAVAVMYPLPKSKGEAEEWWCSYGPARSSSEPSVTAVVYDAE